MPTRRKRVILALVEGESSRVRGVEESVTVLPREVEQFVLDHIGSVQELEILLLLFSRPHREWTGESVALELKLDPRCCADWLADLGRRGFATPNIASAAAVKYAPRPWADSALMSLGQLYSRQWPAIIRLICSKPNEKVQSFASAIQMAKGGGKDDTRG
ncbi:hypothetical protein LZC95_35230 [Pendulispora brunnea]|uniref:Uncharacterized protein n=1 Tax=Pendulispora brunnea TaxID=2905690 RepID=A0ABZ2JYW7_9BACT